jgi:hypothetical protein
MRARCCAQGRLKPQHILIAAMRKLPVIPTRLDADSFSIQAGWYETPS